MDKPVTIIGCGPGAEDLITIKGKKAIEKADVVVGSKRLIKSFLKNSSSRTLILDQDYQEILDKVDRLIKENNNVAFLVSGDPLFHSYGETILKRFGQNNCEIISGISSVQYAFSRIKESWKEYKILTLHGVKDFEIQNIFKENEKFVLLLDPKNNLKQIKKKLKPATGNKYKFYLVSNLSMHNEKIQKLSLEDFSQIEEESLSILIVEKKS